MAKVSLRIYNREIERFVESGHIDEAIAHCRHILKTFPKHLETYRLLGKAYLESRRYADAVDIFGRLLMAVPDDFVAHVGLSIIRDEEGKLDDAIWHMERAFEVQSANAAIQGELQRLYGRRDGMEPPKVRMTRGALARIYVHGELYPQAIAEIRSVLAEDPQRTDMQVLLAHSYFKSGQKTDATDICNQLLKRYAYCFDANRIMVDLLPATTGSVESTQVYRMHIAEMDPYTNFVTGSVFNTTDVPDASVNLERFEYAGEEVQMGQDWNNSSLGFASVPPLGGGTSMVDETPDWLRNSEAETPQTPAVSGSSSQASEELPDFLRAAGWGESNTPEQPTSIFDEEPGDGSLAQGDMPDWLKSQLPTEDQLNQATSSSVETPDYLTKLDSSFDPFADAMAPSMDNTSWLSGEAAEDAASAQPAANSDLPDWLSSLGSGSQEAAVPESNAGSDDWLAGLGGATATGAALGLSNDDEPSLAEPADIPDWLKGSETPSQVEPAAQPNVESLGASSQEQDDAVAWLESLAAKHGAKPEELVTDPNKRSDTPPDWVSQAQTIGSTPAAQPNVESLGASSQEQDDAVAWLESLAAKHGAKPEELVTDPNKRSETPPDWVSQAQTIGSAPAEQPNVESLGASSQEQDDAVAWLESLAAKHGAKPEELVTDPNKRSETPPDWVAQAQTIGSQAPEKEWSETAQNVGEDFFAEFEKASAAEPALDSTGMWLSSHEDEKAKSETASDSDLPAWMKTDEEQDLERAEIPEWLSDAPSSTDAKENSSSALPEWVSEKEEVSESSAFTPEESIVKNQDLSDWLSGLDDEPGLDIDPNTLRAPQTPPVMGSTTQSVPAASSALPDWMNDVESEPELEDDLWKQPLASSQVETPATAAEVPAAVSLSADLPDWLQNVDDDQNQKDASGDDGEDLPPWAHREQWEAEESAPSTPKPTSPADWQPVAATPRKEAAPKQQPRAAQYPPSPEPNATQKKKAPAAKQGLPRSRKPEAQGTVAMLSLAKSELDRGDIPEALTHYGKLIKKGKHLEEIIGELSESIYRYPVEVGIWQALGDAYMRANRLKEALEAYNKAEELIR